MKRALIFLAALTVALTAFGQTSSPVFNSFYSKLEELEAKFQKSYGDKDFKQAEAFLKEALILAENIQLTDTEIPECKPYLDGIKAHMYYNLACSQSLLNKKKEAVSAFAKAVESGYSEYRHAKQDSDLDNIRKDKKFIALLDEIKQYNKLVILQNSGGYRQEKNDSLPRFTYQPADDNNLKEVRRYFNLDAVAGNGDEISKITNLLFFATKIVKHDGSNRALCEFDAIDFYNYHKATGKGINCRHKAMMLNEMYLAMGFKSRYVTCMPKDQSDPDCHVINCVYSETLKKWLWMDPSFGIYVMDENSNLLGIGEVRERLKSEKPLVLNRETEKTKEWYLEYYMAKNLYWLECTNISRFNTESRYRSRAEDLCYISLFPTGNDGGNRYQGYFITHDPEYFWQAPEE